MVTHNIEDGEEVKAVVAQGQNLIKASLFNLIVVADTLKQALRAQELVKIVTEKFPSRVIFVQVDEASQSDFFHAVDSVQCVGIGTTRVCFDQLVIETSPSQLHKVPFIVLPNIMPDLPVFMLLSTVPTREQVILPQLEKYTTRVVFDSDQIDNIKLFSSDMLALLRDAHSDFIDINWAKTKAWREVIGRTFKDAQSIDLLNQSKLIQISYCSPQTQGQPKMQLQAVYLQAWIAAQLGWNLLGIEKDDGVLRLSYHTQTHSSNQPITVSLVPKDTEALDRGALYSVEILTHSDWHFLISHDGPSSQVTIHASNPERCEMPYTLHLSNYQKGTALVNEIFYQPPSEHYANMLSALNNPSWASCSL
jgi:hypothetical protein